MGVYNTSFNRDARKCREGEKWGRILFSSHCRGGVALLAEAIPAATWIDDGEGSLICNRQEVLVSGNQQISLAIDR